MKYQKNTKMYQLFMHNWSSQRSTDIGGYICGNICVITIYKSQKWVKNMGSLWKVGLSQGETIISINEQIKPIWIELQSMFILIKKYFMI